jgi:hypothetical protein
VMEEESFDGDDNLNFFADKPIENPDLNVP